jgi:glycosyltransferase involved in cell wall biosynthesis
MPTQIEWRNVDYLVFVASHIMDIVKGKVPDIEKLTCPKIVPNGVDIDAIPLMEPGDPHEIAYVANINHKKAPELALQIMAALVAKDPAFRLHIAGAYQDERYQIYMKHMMSDMGIEQNVIMYGFVQDMEQFWKGKGAILSTSIHEGHPLNIIEGMARGIRPVIHNFLGARRLYYPVIHNFLGARRLYYDEWLYNTVDEAADQLIKPGNAHSGEYRNYVIDRGWTLAEQMRQFKKLVAKAGEKRK